MDFEYGIKILCDKDHNYRNGWPNFKTQKYTKHLLNTIITFFLFSIYTNTLN